MKLSNVFVVAAISSFVAGAAFAQTTVFDTRDAAADSFEDLQEDIADDAERDIRDFGNVGRQIGFVGSVALSSSVSNGNTDTTDLTFGSNVGYYDGTNGYNANIVYSYGDTDGSKDEDKVIYSLEYNRDLSDRMYAYGQISGSNDSVGVTPVNETFVGVGLGYRVIDTNTNQWSLAAGPGYVSNSASGIFSANDFDEAAFSISSDYSAVVSDTVVVTMDTDIISSSSDTAVTNDIAMSVAMSNALALRTSLITTFNTDPRAGRKDTDNTFGLSVVYAFN